MAVELRVDSYLLSSSGSMLLTFFVRFKVVYWFMNKIRGHFNSAQSA